MSEEDKIIDRVMMIDQWKVAGDIYTQDELNAIGELLDLYNKEKEKNKNSVSKDKIKEDLKRCQKVYEEEMKPYQRDYGLDVTYLTKKEKEELVNKRNCLITQMKTYEMLLED